MVNGFLKIFLETGNPDFNNSALGSEFSKHTPMRNGYFETDFPSVNKRSMVVLFFNFSYLG